jgi:small subunit ribosomal protein S18
MNEETTLPAQAEATQAAPVPEGTPAPRPAQRGRNDDEGSDRKPMIGGGKDARGRGRRRRKVSFLTLNKIHFVDYKDIGLLRRFVNDQGKIVSSRQSGTTAKEQRMVSQAIRRAREMALLPFVALDNSNSDRPGMRPERRGPRAPRQYDQEAPRPAPPAGPAAPAPAPAPAPEAQAEPSAE